MWDSGIDAPVVHFRWGMDVSQRRNDCRCAETWSGSSPNSFAARFLYMDESGFEGS